MEVSALIERAADEAILTGAPQVVSYDGGWVLVCTKSYAEERLPEGEELPKPTLTSEAGHELLVMRLPPGGEVGMEHLTHWVSKGGQILWRPAEVEGVYGAGKPRRAEDG